MTKKCEFRKKDGERCDANAQAGKDSCVFHDPAPLRNTTEVSAFLAKSINQVLRGALDPRVANSAGYLANVLLRSLEQGPLEIRMARLEAALDIAKDPHTAASGKDSLPV